ncbi:MAG: hypothetical protein DRO96_01440 [Candidatus Aenigmatarchaeota archaeon]|nr:MAG: hypothetical protein DRO96_01440 [Candidatus Aenigmarchaeota archaeon]
MSFITKLKPTPKEAILKYLEGVEEASTKKIAKKLGMAWGTADINCRILKSEGKINKKTHYQGYRKSNIWSLKVD